MKAFIVALALVPTLACAFTPTELGHALGKAELKAALAKQSIVTISESPCGRMAGDYCFSIETSEQITYEVYGNTVFDKLEVTKIGE